MRNGKGIEETTGSGGASTSTGTSSAGGAAAPPGDRWASRLAQGIRPSSPLAQQQEQQQQGSSRATAAETVTDWSPTRELSRNSGNSDYLNLGVQQQGGLAVEVGQGSRNYRASAPGNSNPLLWRVTTNRVKASAEVAGISTAKTRTTQALVADIAAQPGKNGTLGPRSDSGMYDPARNAGRLAPARPGACGPGVEPEALEVKGCSGSSEHNPGSGASGRRYEPLEVAEAEGEVNSYVPSNGLKSKPLIEEAQGIGGGNAGGGKGGSKASDSKWTRSRAGKTLAMFRMQAAARRVAEETEKQKQEREGEQERERLEYVPQASLQRRVCTPPSTPSTQPRDGDAQNDAGGADHLPYKDGIGVARMANRPPPPPSSLQQQQRQQQQQQQQEQQQQRLEVWAGAQGTSSSPADLPYARQAGLLARKVVSERIIWPRSHMVSGNEGVGPPPAADEPPLYAVPGSTEPVPVRGMMPGTQQGASPQPPPLPPGQFLNQDHDHDSSSRNRLWLYPQLPRHSQPQGQAPPVPPPPQQAHSSPLLKASSSMQQRPPSSGRTMNTQLSLGHQARNYFQMVSKLRDQRPGSPGGRSGLGQGPAAITGSSDRGLTEGIVRRSTYGGQLPADEITSDRTMRLYPYPATTVKSAALMSKQQSGKQIVTAVMPKAEMVTPPPLSLSPSLSRSVLRSPTQQLQRKDSRLGASISEGAVAGGPDISSSSPVGSHLHAKKHVLSKEVRQLEPTTTGLVRATSKTPCENDVPSGSSERGFMGPGLAVDKSRSYRHSEPYGPSADAMQSPQGLSTPRALTPQATMAPHPLPRRPLPLPGLLPTEEDQRKESERSAFATTMTVIDTQVDTASKAAHAPVTPLPPPPLAPPQLLPLPQPIMAIGIPTQPQYHAYVHHYQPQTSYQPYIIYQPEAAPVLVPQK
ncbi:hypothetical protein Vafri_2854 [Volvox africanus]|uniref:Uncharacterized protein n=1 Tax=Volvox africanus TaxID=51714 RepID=A0A8J4EU41_9CHLO|nr:hypothetical protein Vafri_2854 [Volvox africanus]